MVVPAIAWSQGAGAQTLSTASPIPMGGDRAFAVVAGSTITNTGPTMVTGDVGLDPGSAITGLPTGQIDGTEDIDNGPAVQAQGDLTTAYNDAAGLAPPPPSPPTSVA